ncbi:SDR family NAD(P)-dependent oxidoreductase [Aspergillus homomorphus CBS 101889]|uniref:NAD(P)-binding protein n=1 Tax=Aspergillus homomorphus (strain CBS 101889) TaxID=1450537 RepID=A0A395HKC0_ASPHC|nr:NAD(P)-binding protein [Aspergillus homomorphus CBS 101889]RAL07873.1 NAD(P)-binding protein [Aspergillus homomorphus CBS 101889]
MQLTLCCAVLYCAMLHGIIITPSLPDRLSKTSHHRLNHHGHQSLRFRSGATALITGAASGIGFAAAQLCHQHGMNLILLDIDSAQLTTAAKTLTDNATTPKIHTFVLDVSKREDWTRHKPAILTLCPQGIDLLMLNAGRLARPTEGKTPWEDPEYFESTFATNTFGYTNGLAAFLESVTDSSRSDTPRAVVLTGSKQGITNPPGNPAYNASKSAVKTIAEHLSYDLHVHIRMSVCISGCWTPEETVAFMAKKMAAGSFYIICPDNEVTEEMDRKRIAWASGDVIHDRPALSRWRADWKEKAAKGIEKLDVGK